MVSLEAKEFFITINKYYMKLLTIKQYLKESKEEDDKENKEKKKVESEEFKPKKDIVGNDSLVRLSKMQDC